MPKLPASGSFGQAGQAAALPAARANGRRRCRPQGQGGQRLRRLQERMGGGAADRKGRAGSGFAGCKSEWAAALPTARAGQAAASPAARAKAQGGELRRCRSFSQKMQSPILETAFG
ncbi:hypothetical protein [Saccharibacillus qingshengii]|uniref:hypothetical protein n=1 Tax=Saccharibacillus qingshengii TaxID=1763540 RepID=UPI0015521A99|nr:hypothetical protein [Saccharibacillus qingshengii]